MFWNRSQRGYGASAGVISVVEQPQPSMNQGHSVLQASFSHFVAATGATRLDDEFDAVFAGMVDIVAKGNESIAYERDTVHFLQPLCSFFSAQSLGRNLERILKGNCLVMRKISFDIPDSPVNAFLALDIIPKSK